MASQPTGYDLLELQRRIATRVRHGGSEADVEREIIAPAALSSSQLPALRLYASSQVDLHRARGRAASASDPTSRARRIGTAGR